MIADPDASPRLPRKGSAVLAYCISFLAAMLVYVTLQPTGLWLAATFAAPALSLAWMVAVVVRLRRERVCVPSPANRAYMRRFIPTMLLYVAVLFAVVWLQDRMKPAGSTAVVLAILPALPLIGVVWALGRLLVEETDEYLRSLIVRQYMIATGFMLCVTSIWGFLDAFHQTPHVPMYWAFVIWCVGLGIGGFVNEMRS
jgi:hypothetical protein